MEEKKTLEGATLNTENTNIEGEKKIVGGSVELNPDVVLDVETETPETEMPAEDAEDLIAEMYQQAALLTDKANDLIQTANALMGANSISTLDLNVDDGGTPTPSLKSAPMMLAANAGGGESLPTFQPTGKALNSVPTPTSVTPASANVFVNEGGNIKQVAVMNLAKSINNLIKATPSSAIPYVLGSDANGNQIASTIENLAQVVAGELNIFQQDYTYVGTGQTIDVECCQGLFFMYIPTSGLSCVFYKGHNTISVICGNAGKLDLSFYDGKLRVTNNASSTYRFIFVGFSFEY